MGFVDRKFIPLALLVPAALVVGTPMLAQAEDDQDNYAGEAADRYAQVRVLEGGATVRKGDLEEALGIGVPVGEGDVVESRGRGVLQLGDGSRVAFSAGTRFTVAALFMERSGARQVLLKLESGRLRISVGNDAYTRIRVDSPFGSVSLGEKANVALGLDRQVLDVKVFSTRATVQNQGDQLTLGAGEWIQVYSLGDRLDRVRAFNTYDLDEFESWSGPRLAQRRARDLDRLPPEIRSYGDELSGNGDWVYVSEIQTYCWHPRGISPEWRPYWRGRWASYPGGMTWVSDEPWGFVTHHYGRWGWNLSFGWYWIPGIQYSPAWVAWQNSGTYFGWAPLGYYDAPCTWGYGAWAGGYCWNVVEINFISSPGIHHHMYPGWRNIQDFGPRGDRPIGAPWHRAPLMVRPGEMRNPNQFRQVTQQRDLRRERMVDYSRRSEQATGRKVFRDPQIRPGGAHAQRPLTQSGFVERERQWQRPQSADPRKTPSGTVPPNRQQQGDRGRRTEPAQPRQAPGGTSVPASREQPRSRGEERPTRRVDPARPVDSPQNRTAPQSSRPSPNQREGREGVDRPAAVKETPARNKEEQPRKERHEERN